MAPPALAPTQPCQQIRCFVPVPLDRPGAHDREPSVDERLQPPLALGLSAIIGTDRGIPWIAGCIFGEAGQGEPPPVVSGDRRDIEVVRGLVPQAPGGRFGDRRVERPHVDDRVPPTGPDSRPVFLGSRRAPEPPQLLEVREELRVGQASVEQRDRVPRDHGLAHHRGPEKAGAAEHEDPLRTLLRGGSACAGSAQEGHARHGHGTLDEASAIHTTPTRLGWYGCRRDGFSGFGGRTGPKPSRIRSWLNLGAAGSVGIRRRTIPC